MGFLKSINYTFDQSAPWETEAGKRVPKHIMVAITYKVIHSEVPGLFDSNNELQKFYGYIGD